MAIDTINLAELAYQMWLGEEERTAEQNILTARDYYAGDFDLPLTDRQWQYLGLKREDPFGANYGRIVVNAVAERLIVKGFECADDAARAWATALWQANRLDGTAGEIHRNALRDGEHFVLVEWNPALRRPVFIPHERYTGPDVEGTGYGVKAFYPDDDTNQPMQYAAKRWTATEKDVRGHPSTRQRMTVYFPDRVERYGMGKGGVWESYQAMQPWVDAQRQPLGIPVIHFRNANGVSELWDAIPLQDAINKALLDVLAAQDAAGFPLLIARGFNLVDKDGVSLKLAPGSWIGTPDASCDVTRMEAADLTQMLTVVDSLIVKLAQVTDTPVSRFQLTGQVAAEGTLKQQDEPLLAKCRNRQVSFGDAWEDCFYMARRLANLFGQAGLDESALLETQWEPLQARDETQFLTQLALKREKLNIPLRQLWAEAGYSEEEIAQMMDEPEIQNLTFATYPAPAPGGADVAEDEEAMPQQTVRTADV